MPEIRPFRGVEYARTGDLTDLVCPPYDVIGPDEQAALLARNDRNAVRLELPTAPDPYQAAAVTLDAWLTDGTLVRRPDPVLYFYRHATPAAPDEPTVRGVLASLRLQHFGTEVRAHEHTMPGPKADRLAHLRATRTQVSPILGIYFDSSERYGEVMPGAGSDERHARDGDGLLHSVAAVEPDDALLGYLSHRPVFIADGHHRYETALAYQAEVRADPRWTDAPPGSLAADWIMIGLVNAEMEQLEVLPTHRLILAADAEALRALKEADPLWQALPVDPSELHARLDELRDAEEPVFGLVLPGDKGWLLVGDREGTADRMRREAASAAVHGLDLAILHASILGDRLGIDAGAVAEGGSLAYTRSEADARAAVADGEARAAILVRPTRLDQLAEVASAGDVMPQKSTYFYPKLLTGFVFNPLED